MNRSGKKTPGINKYLIYFHLPFTIAWLIMKAVMWIKGSAILIFYDADEYMAYLSYESTLHGGLSVLLPICYAIFVIICGICIGKIYKRNFENMNIINYAIPAFGVCEMTECIMILAFKLIAKDVEVFGLFEYMDLNLKHNIVRSTVGYIICLILHKCFQSANDTAKHTF